MKLTQQEDYRKHSSLINNITNNATSTLRVVVNRECTLNCKWCYKEGVDHDNSIPTLTADTFIRAIRIAKDQGYDKINFTGGEPLIYPYLYRIVKEADDLGLKTYVTTNGTVMGGIELDKWTALKNHEFHVSLHTTNKKEFKDISGEDMHDNVIKGIIALREQEIPFKLNVVVTSKADWPRIRSVLDFAKELNLIVKLLGVHDCSVIESMPQKAVGEMLLDNGAEYVKRSSGGSVNYGYSQYDYQGTRVHVLNMLYGGGCCDRYKKGFCGEGIRYPRIIYTGEVKPCLHKTVGVIRNNSTNEEIGGLLGASKDFLNGLSKLPYTIDFHTP